MVVAGWLTPTEAAAGAAHGGSSAGNDLRNQVRLAGWPTPVANDDNKTPEAHLAMKLRMGVRDGTGAERMAITSLQVMAQTADLAGWATPNVPNGGRTSNDSNWRPDGTKQQVDLGAQARLAGWPTPIATDEAHGHSATWATTRCNLHNVALGIGRQTTGEVVPAAEAVPAGHPSLSGTTSTSSPAATARRGVLNPALPAG
jgi:hypothetical protein